MTQAKGLDGSSTAIWMASRHRAEQGQNRLMESCATCIQQAVNILKSIKPAFIDITAQCDVVLSVL